jgi:translation initiation factor IF-2
MSQPENTNFYRLIKLTKEFNVGLHTLVEALEKKGVKVELNPNAKIDEQAYAFLVKEYGHEISLKAAAQKVDLKPIKEGNVSLSLEEEPVVAVPKSYVAPKPVIPPTPAATPTPAPAPAPVSMPVAEPVAEPVAPAKPVQEVRIEQKEETPETPKPDISEEKPVKVQGLKILGKIDLDQTVVKSRSSEEKVVEKIPEEKPVAQEIVEQIEEVVAVVEKPEDAKPNPVEIKTEIKNEPVPVVEVVEVVEVSEVVIPTAVKEEAITPVVVEADKETDMHIETVYTKLSGPNVVGKIDLAQFAKKPVVKTDKPHFEDKKKRARIEKKVKVSVDPKAVQGQNGQGGGAAGANKPPLHHNHPKGKPPVGGVKKPAFQEVDEEAVQRQIKDTLARLTAKGSKTKSSKYSRDKRDKYSQRMSEEMERQEMEKNIIQVTEFVTVSELANLMDVPVNQVIGACMNLGLMVSINQRLDAEALVLVAEEFGFQIEFVSGQT